MNNRAQLPDKLYFKIGEVARIVGVKPHVLRYWESEFRIIRPGKSQSRHRLYRRRDVETLLQIKQLLYDERFTIEGAKKQLRAGAKPAARVPKQQLLLPFGERTYRQMLTRVKQDLEELLRVLR